MAKMGDELLQQFMEIAQELHANNDASLRVVHLLAYCRMLRSDSYMSSLSARISGLSRPLTSLGARLCRVGAA
jgi:hypothetical protein